MLSMPGEQVRLYVGGLPSTVSCTQISQRFESFGKVHGVELVAEKEGTVRASQPLQSCRGFAYVQFSPSDEASLRRCISMVWPQSQNLRAHKCPLPVYMREQLEYECTSAVQWMQVAGRHPACRTGEARLQAAPG